jgi:hypothetical protein
LSRIIEFISEEYFSKHINIKTQLKQKVFTKVINLIKLRRLGQRDLQV